MMSTIVDENNSGINPESEVRKLQDLVKKLERQNQILRSKQQNQRETTVISAKGSDDSNCTITKQHKNNSSPDTENLKESMKNITLEDVDILDVDNASTEEEEDSWLYSSPKRPSLAQRNISPYKWVRRDFEYPRPEVESAKRSLLFKLDEVSRVSRSSSSGTVGSLPSPAGTAALPGEVPQPSDITTVPNKGTMPAIRQPIVLGLGHLRESSRVDTSTFSRPKKNKLKKCLQQNYVDIENNDLTDELDSSNEKPNLNTSNQRDLQDEESKGSDDDSGVLKLTDVVDVQVLARMQEESLRQSFNSPMASPRKLSKSLNTTGLRSLANQDADNSPSSQSSARSSPGRFDGDFYQSTRRSNNSLASASSNSNTSSPPDSPYGSQYLDARPIVSDVHRRSLPNLTRMSLPQNNYTDSRILKESPPRGQYSAANRTRVLGGAVRQASPVRAGSPQRSGIPSPRSSGIPRPGSASKLRPPRKSSIPSARRSLTPRVDESWKEGCY